MNRFSLETVYQVWDDNSGFRIEVGPDGDSIGLIEIKHRDEKNEIFARITFPKEAAQFIADSIIKAANDIE